MKRIYFLLAILSSWGMQVWSQPKISFSEKQHDFGTIAWNRPVTAVFKVTNTGNKPLVISNVTTSCGCAVAGWTKQPILPGKSGEVSSTFDAKAIGRFHKTVGIYSNASPQPVYLVIKGKVSSDATDYTLTHPLAIGPIRLDRNNIEFKDANRGEVLEEEIYIANTSDQTYTPVLMHLPPYLKAEAFPAKLRGGAAGKIKLTLDTRQLKHLGLTQTSVYLARYPGDRVGEENEIAVSAVLLPDFSNWPAQQRKNAPVIKLSQTEVDMGKLGVKDKVSHTIVITNTGKSRLDIRELQVFNSSVNVSLKKRYIEPGASTKLKVTLLGKFLKKAKNTPRVLMITNDPEHPKVTIRLKATTK